MRSYNIFFFKSFCRHIFPECASREIKRKIDFFVFFFHAPKRYAKFWHNWCSSFSNIMSTSNILLSWIGNFSGLNRDVLLQRDDRMQRNYHLKRHDRSTRDDRIIRDEQRDDEMITVDGRDKKMSRGDRERRTFAPAQLFALTVIKRKELNILKVYPAMYWKIISATNTSS